MSTQNMARYSAYIGMLIFGMAMLSLGSASAYLTGDRQLSQLTLASLSALLPAGILVGSMIFGPIVDRFGYRFLLAYSTLGIAVGFLLISMTGSLLLLQLSFFLIGFGGGAVNGGTNALVADISESDKGAGLSLLGVFYGIGALGMPLLIGLFNRYISNQTLLQFFAFLVFLTFIRFLFATFPEPKQNQGFPIAQGLKLLKQPVLLLMGFFLFFESGIEGISNTWTAAYLRDSAGISTEHSLYALSIMILALTLTRLVLGSLLKKYSSIAVLALSLLIIFCGSLLLNFASGLNTAVLGLILLGIGSAAGFPVILGYVGDLFSDLSGTAFSVALVIALIGNSGLNFLVGLLSSMDKLSLFPGLISISAIIMSGLLIIIANTVASSTAQQK